MNRGQITTIDFILAAVIAVFCIGALMSFAELKTYEIKENIGAKILEEKTGTAIAVLASGAKTGCTKGDYNLAYSVDFAKIDAADEGALKKMLGFDASENYKVNLKIGDSKILTDVPDGKNTLASSFDAIVCNNTAATVSGPIAMWHLNDTLQDEIGVNNLTKSGCEWVYGKDKNALKFNGAPDYAYANVTNIPVGSTARTLSAWLKPASTTSSYRGAVGWGTNTNSREVFTLFQSNNNKWKLITWADDHEFGNPIVPGSWYHVVLTYESGSSTVKAYLNGTLSSDLSLNGGELNTSDNYFTIGKASYVDTWFNGVIDEVAIWDRALSADEIRALYLAGLYRVSRETITLKVSK